MNVLHVLAAAVVALGFFAVPLSAHHAWPVSRDKLVTVKGTVTSPRLPEGAPQTTTGAVLLATARLANSTGAPAMVWPPR